MSLAVEDDVATDPRDVGVLSAATVVAGAQDSANAVEQTRPQSALGSGLSDGERTSLAPLHGGSEPIPPFHLTATPSPPFVPESTIARGW
jgi:hypothetical protein